MNLIIVQLLTLLIFLHNIIHYTKKHIIKDKERQTGRADKAIGDTKNACVCALKMYVYGRSISLN